MEDENKVTPGMVVTGIAVIGLLALAVAFIVQCAAPDPITGTWYHEKAGFSTTWEFKSDGTATEFATGVGSGGYRYTWKAKSNGRYSIGGNLSVDAYIDKKGVLHIGSAELYRDRQEAIDAAR